MSNKLTLEQAILWFERELPERNTRLLARREQDLPLEARWEWRGEHLDEWYLWVRSTQCGQQAEIPRHIRHPLLVERRLLMLLVEEKGCEHLAPLLKELSHEIDHIKEHGPRDEDLVPWCAWPYR